MYACTYACVCMYVRIHTAADFNLTQPYYVQVPFSWWATVAAKQKENCQQTTKGRHQATVQHKEMPHLNMHNNCHFEN